MQNYKLRLLFSLSCVGLILAIASCSSAPKPSDGQKEIEFAQRAESFVNVGKYNEAIAEIKEGLKMSPNSAVLYGQLGWIYFVTKQFPQAIEMSNKSIALDPNNGRAYKTLGSAYFRQRNHKAALESFLTAYKLLPEDPQNANNVANAYASSGDDKNAYEYFKTYLKISDDREMKKKVADWMRARKFEVPPYENEVVSLFEQKKFDDVESRLSALLKSKETDVDGESKLADAYDELIHVKQVRDLADEWASRKPNSAFAKSVLGAASIDSAWAIRGSGFSSTVTEDASDKFKERLKMARKYLEKSLEIDPSNYQTILELIVVSKSDKASRESILALYKKGIQLDPNNYGICRQMEDVFSPKWGGSVAEMLDFARNVKNSSGEKSKGPLLLARAHWDIVGTYYRADMNKYFKQPDVWKESRESIEMALKRYPNSVQVKTYMVRTAFAAGDLPLAKKYFEDIKDHLDLKLWGDQELQNVKRTLASVSPAQ